MYYELHVYMYYELHVYMYVWPVECIIVIPSCVFYRGASLEA